MSSIDSLFSSTNDCEHLVLMIYLMFVLYYTHLLLNVWISEMMYDVTDVHLIYSNISDNVVSFRFWGCQSIHQERDHTHSQTMEALKLSSLVFNVVICAPVFSFQRCVFASGGFEWFMSTSFAILMWGLSSMSRRYPIWWQFNRKYRHPYGNK